MTTAPQGSTAAADPTAPVTTAIDGFVMCLAERSFQVA